MEEVRIFCGCMECHPGSQLCGIQEKFESLPLDDRLRKALAHLGWQFTTPVQSKAIPLALRGKDVLARARTGA